MGKRKGPNLPDNETLELAGIDPKTGLPKRLAGVGFIKNQIKLQLQVQDQQIAVNRYKWTNIAPRLTSTELESLVYNRGNLCMFYYKELDSYYIMPYALDGTIDFYGRYNRIHPVPIASDGDEYKAQKLLLKNIKLKVIYDERDITEDMDKNHVAILLYDFTKGISQNNVARVQMQRGLIDVMSECIPYMRTALKNSTGITGVRVEDEDCASNVIAANQTLDKAALDGDRYVPINSPLDIEPLTEGTVAKAEEYMQAFQSLDNYRKGLYGIANGGVFEKKAHVLESEQDMNGSGSSSELEDGLVIRQHFCALAKKIWGVDMNVSVNESVMQQESDEEALNEDNLDEGGEQDE